MTVEVIRSNNICEYCRNKYDYNFTGEICPYWYAGSLCIEGEDFEGKELIEICGNDEGR